MRKLRYLIVYGLGAVTIILNALWYFAILDGLVVLVLCTVATHAMLFMVLALEYREANLTIQTPNYQENCLEIATSMVVKPGIVAIFIATIFLQYIGFLQRLNGSMQSIQMNVLDRIVYALFLVSPTGFCLSYPIVVPFYVIWRNAIRRKSRAKAQ